MSFYKKMSMKNIKIENTMKYSQINTCLQNNMLDNLETWEVEPMEMYQDIFSTMELEKKGVQEQGKYNLICIQVGYDKNLNKKGVRRFFVHQGLKELDNLIIESIGKTYNYNNIITNNY